MSFVRHLNDEQAWNHYTMISGDRAYSYQFFVVSQRRFRLEVDSKSSCTDNGGSCDVLMITNPCIDIHFIMAAPFVLGDTICCKNQLIPWKGPENSGYIHSVGSWGYQALYVSTFLVFNLQEMIEQWFFFNC